MPDRDDRNPYLEAEPRLRQAWEDGQWEDGYRARKEGGQATLSHDDPSGRMRAWVKGYEGLRSLDAD